ncbi:glycosyltransferase family 4 protein [uncultured Thiodictyon sp.]|jgi:glycosyltransferase involved in cell wall biosynthesis|uniref:glycosyltransferase family 4 protein n=1 Tax=uncultured Thiodictyon sp. TaxID=1846217 RepID=UPI0025D07538|nr:glycosyltransferase family 4 protein [uncultured Thiodictyon sp.]
MSHILLLTLLRYPEIQGGVDAMVVNLATQLQLRHKVSVFVPGDWSVESLRRGEADGIDVFSLRLRMPYGGGRPLADFFGWILEFPRTLLTLRSLMSTQGIDLIHAQVAKDYHMYLRVLRWIGGPPYVVTLHGSDVAAFSAQHKLSQWLVKFALRGAARIIGVSRWLARDAERLFPGIGPVICVYNGLQLPARGVSAGPLVAQWLEPVPEPFVILVGSLDSYKGHDLALRAWAELPAEAGRLHLLIVGEGEGRPEYETLVAELGCQERVRLVGQVIHDDVLRLMSRAVAVLLPSRREGFAYALLEAGALGALVICTRIPAFEEIIENGVNGIMVPVEDVPALVVALARVAAEPALRDRLGQRLQEKVRADFQAEGMAAGYNCIYDSVLKGNRCGVKRLGR